MRHQLSNISTENQCDAPAAMHRVEEEVRSLIMSDKEPSMDTTQLRLDCFPAEPGFYC